MSDSLLDWFDRHGRDLPWRCREVSADPYRVWLSEIMLQQTTVAAVTPYFEEFLKRWPDVGALAAASQDEVLEAWAGLGYYSRARNLLKSARIVNYEKLGRFPRTAATLQELPGIGPYTAAAIAAIAYGEKVAVVDGNVERVIARLFALPGQIKEIRDQIKTIVNDMVPAARAGDFAEAMMDLGATICRPKAPKCELCPLRVACKAKAQGLEEAFPNRSYRKTKPQRSGTAYVLTSTGEVCLVRRPDNGLLGGMLAFPSDDWREGQPAPREQVLVAGPWIQLPGQVRHSFTHFDLSLEVLRLELPDEVPRPDGHWVGIDRLESVGLPSLMRKVARFAFD